MLAEHGLDHRIDQEEGNEEPEEIGHDQAVRRVHRPGERQRHGEDGDRLHDLPDREPMPLGRSHPRPPDVRYDLAIVPSVSSRSKRRAGSAHRRKTLSSG